MLGYIAQECHKMYFGPTSLSDSKTKNKIKTLLFSVKAFLFFVFSVAVAGCKYLGFPDW